MRVGVDSLYRFKQNVWKLINYLCDFSDLCDLSDINDFEIHDGHLIINTVPSLPSPSNVKMGCTKFEADRPNRFLAKKLSKKWSSDLCDFVDFEVQDG